MAPVATASATPFFFYGTLCDAEVRARVLGAAAAGLALTPATAPGWRAVYARGRDFPVLVPGRGDAAPGLLAEGLGRDGLRRLLAYEGGGYSVRPVSVLSEAGPPVRAAAFLPRRALRPGSRRFVLGDWQASRRGRYLKRFARCVARPNGRSPPP